MKKKNNPVAWKLSAISSAVAFAIASMNAPVAQAIVFSPTQTLTGTQTSTNAAGVTINGVNTTAVFVDSAATGVTINNSGTISASNSSAIYVDSSAVNTTINNQASGIISASGSYSAIYFSNNLDGSLTNAGKIISTGSDYAAGIYVSNDLTGKIVNTGTISATAGVSSRATAYGIYVGNNLTGSIANNGAINSTAISTGSNAYAYGIYVGNDLTGSIVNNGAINATAISTNTHAYAYGIYVGGSAAGAITNNGSISIDITAHTDPSAYGIYVGNDLTGSIVNKGTIDINEISTASDLRAYGIYVGGNVAGSIANSGSIHMALNPESYVYTGAGIYVGSDVTSLGSINNSGTISIEANSNGYYVGAFGIDVSGNNQGQIINSGDISVLANARDRANAYGIYVGNNLDAGASIANSGRITATANTYSLSQAYAYGIYAGGNADGTITNTGSINVTATAATGSAGAAGIYVGNNLTGSLINSGTITASANSLTNPNSAYAYGIYANTLDGSIINSGTITATAPIGSNAYSIFAGSGVGTVTNSGTLNGNLILGGTVNLANSGRVSIPSGASFFSSAYIGGNYTQTGNGVYVAGVQSAALGGYGQMFVNGTADISANNKIGLHVSNDNTLANGNTLTNVLFANTLVTGSALTVSDNNLPFNFTAINTGNGIDITAVSTGLTTVAAAVGNGSGAGAAAVFDTLLGADLSGDLATVIDALGSSGTAADVRNAVQQTLPLLSGSLSQVSLNNVHSGNRIISARQDSARGESSGDLFISNSNFWLKPFGSRADQDKNNGAAGYGANTYGIAAGVDGDISDVNRLGAAFIYSHSNVDSDVSGSGADINSYLGAVYGSHNLDESTYVDGQLDFSVNKNDSKRNITFGGLNRSAAAAFDSFATHAGISLGRVIDIDAKTTFTPSVRADYVYIHDDGYSEKGAGVLNLKVRSNNTDELIVGVDGKVTYAVNDYAKLVGNAGIGYNVLNSDNSITSSFAGAPGAVFSTKGIDNGRWLGRGGFGLVMNTASSIQITARYDLELRDNFTDQTASVKVLVPF